MTSTRGIFRQIFPGRLPLIGVVHLPPLPGYPGAPSVEALVEHAVRDLEVLESLGYDGILIENENDQPHQVLSAPETTACMTRIVAEAVRVARRIVVGAEILLNDPKASLAVAKAAGARFIRTDYFVDRMARDEYGGEMTIDAPGLIAYRKKIGSHDEVAILADVQVKYARLLEKRSLGASTVLARDAGADAVVVTGQLTGNAPVLGHLAEAQAAAGGHPILIGSGLTAENAAEILAYADGAIVGTGIMSNGHMDRDRAGKLMTVVERLRKKG